MIAASSYPFDGHSTAAERNAPFIADALEKVFPERGLVLEIASGTGQHVTAFAAAFPHLDFQPSDPNEGAREAIAARVKHSGSPNLRPPIDFDVTGDWPKDAFEAVICINMIHIAPWPVTRALFEGAAGVLRPGSPLVLYGPFFRADIETAQSNLDFDASLRGRNPEWGIRYFEHVSEEAARAGFTEPDVSEMPSNNLLVTFRWGRPLAPEWGARDPAAGALRA